MSISNSEYQYYCVGFPIRPAQPSKRGLVFGVGNNDATYAVEPSVQNSRFCCPAFRCWKQMLKRCKTGKTYRDVEVCEEWKLFSNFRHWYFTELSKTPWMPGEFAIDKDILGGGKLYSPQTCLLVPPALNNFLLGSESIRGNYPIGVTWHRTKQKFLARVGNPKVNLGHFDCPNEAHQAWLKAKLELCDTIELPDHWSKSGKRFVRKRLKTLVRKMK